MASRPGQNLARLQEAGFAIKYPLPEEYEEVIEELDDEQVALLITLKRRIEEAEAKTRMPPFREYVLAPPF